MIKSIIRSGRHRLKLSLKKKKEIEREAYIYKSIHIGNDICHMLVQFSMKAQKPHCIRTCKCRLLQTNLQLCYNAIINIESHFNCKTKNIILFTYLTLSLSHFIFSSLFFISFLSPQRPLSLSFSHYISLLRLGYSGVGLAGAWIWWRRGSSGFADENPFEPDTKLVPQAQKLKVSAQLNRWSRARMIRSGQKLDRPN